MRRKQEVAAFRARRFADAGRLAAAYDAARAARAAHGRRPPLCGAIRAAGSATAGG
jgi:hypothetical protein